MHRIRPSHEHECNAGCTKLSKSSVRETNRKCIFSFVVFLPAVDKQTSSVRRSHIYNTEAGQNMHNNLCKGRCYQRSFESSVVGFGCSHISSSSWVQRYHALLTNSWEEVRLGSFTFFLNRCSNFHSGPRALLRRYISLRTRSLNFPHIDTITNDSAGSRSPEIFSSQHQLTPEKKKKSCKTRGPLHFRSSSPYSP